MPTEEYSDQNFQPVAAYQILPGGIRHKCHTANTSAALCTKTRWPVESLFGHETNLKITGGKQETAHQLLRGCKIVGFEAQPTLYVCLMVCDSLLKTYPRPYNLHYPTVDTYYQHGQDIRSRLTMENPLSDLSGIQFSRNLMRKPLAREMLPHGRIRRVDIMAQGLTGFPPITPDEMNSATLGSFQSRLVHAYITKLR